MYFAEIVVLPCVAAELSQCLDKMAAVNSVVKQWRFDKNALIMPRLAICCGDLHWHWINWTQLDNTMGMSVVPSVADHRTACVPARIDR